MGRTRLCFFAIAVLSAPVLLPIQADAGPTTDVSLVQRARAEWFVPMADGAKRYTHVRLVVNHSALGAGKTTLALDIARCRRRAGGSYSCRDLRSIRKTSGVEVEFSPDHAWATASFRAFRQVHHVGWNASAPYGTYEGSYECMDGSERARGVARRAEAEGVVSNVRLDNGSQAQGFLARFAQVGDCGS